GKPRAAEAAYKEALELATAAEHRGEVAAASLGLLHAVGVSQRRFDVLEPWDATVQANADALDEPRTRARLLQTRAALDRARMEYGDARTHLEALLEMREEDRGKTHVSLLSVRADLAELELLADNPAEALAHAEEAVRLAERTLVGKDLRHARVRGLLGRALLASAAPTEALVHLQASDEARIYPRPAAEERDAIVVGTAYAQALAAVGRHEEVAAAFEDAWQVWPNRRDNAAVRHAQGEWLLDQGKPEAGLAAHQAGLAAAVESVGSETGAWLTESLIALARGQLRAGQLEQAAATGTRAATVVETTPYGALWGPVYALRGDIARTRGDLETAMTLLDDAYVPLVGAYGVGHRQIDRNVLDRADVAWDLKKTDYAKRLYGNVVDNLEARLGAEHPDVVRARTRAAE
ncbi:MAG: tetratricopeptide repeat protein, partial [Myxococcota bacterium]